MVVTSVYHKYSPELDQPSSGLRKENVGNSDRLYVALSAQNPLSPSGSAYLRLYGLPTSGFCKTPLWSPLRCCWFGEVAGKIGAIRASMNRVLQPRPLIVLGLNVWMGTAVGADELVEVPYTYADLA